MIDGAGDTEGTEGIGQAVPQPRRWTRRQVLGYGAGAAAGGGALASSGMLGAAGRLLVPAAGAAGPVDWSRAVIDSLIARNPNPAVLGNTKWNYPQGLTFGGTYLTYKRTGDPAYLAYIKKWVDTYVNSSGGFSFPVERLDAFQPANLLLDLYEETGGSRYKTAANKIRTRLDTYARQSDGGYLHVLNRPGQIWSDGTFMLTPFLVRHGKRFGDPVTANAEAVKQLQVYASRLQTSAGRMHHVYDETKQVACVSRTTGLSAEHWGRGQGWFAMALVEVLEVLPAGHPGRPALLDILRRLLVAVVADQDPATGRWWQVLNRGGASGNWTETSCSAMFTYALSRSVQRGYVDAGYGTAAARGYEGVLDRISLDSSGRANLTNICPGTGCGDLAFYYARPRDTNDLHGLGAFLVMNEQLAAAGPPPSTTTTTGPGSTSTTVASTTTTVASTTTTTSPPATQDVTLRRTGSGTIEIRWTPVARATSYRWQLLTCAGKTIVTSDTTALVKSKGGLAKGCYRGRVMAKVGSTWTPWRTSADFQLT